MEIEISNDTMISGVIHDYYKKDQYSHTRIEGIINWKDSIFTITEKNEISTNINSKIYENCLGDMKLKLSQNGNIFYLIGKWRDQNRKIFNCPTLKVRFEKIVDEKSAMASQNLALIRQTDVQEIIEVTPDEIDSIKCAVYDNGEIDNDTVTVFYDDSLVLKSQRLSQTPIEFYISLDKKIKVHKIKLVADNLGYIPPNTALLIISTKYNRYTITLSSDLNKTGSVEFFLKE